jgi:hypothetical protein
MSLLHASHNIAAVHHNRVGAAVLVPLSWRCELT